MKRTIIIGMIIVLLLSNTIGVFADAASYDMEKAGYYVYVATPDGGLNIRSGPGTEYDRIMEGRIPDGVRLYIEYVSGTWGLTSYNGNHGWVALKQTTPNPPVVPTVTVAPTAPPTTQTPQNTAVTTAAPQETASSAVDNNEVETTNEDSGAATTMMISQILLAAVLIVLVIAVTIVLVIVINTRSNK